MRPTVQKIATMQDARLRSRPSRSLGVPTRHESRVWIDTSRMKLAPHISFRQKETGLTQVIRYKGDYRQP
jgi:hypothetical protein